MKSYCWGNVGKEENEKDEFVKRYAEWMGKPQGVCPYKDPDEVSGLNYEFYGEITKFLKKQQERYSICFDYEWEFEEPKPERKSPEDRTITLKLKKNEDDKEAYLYLTSDQFGFSANKDIYDNKNDRLKKKYPFVKYVKNYGGSDSLVGETIWYTRTIGGSFLWPKVDQNGWRSLYNKNRGVGSYIEDRVDLTLYEIKEFYDEYSVEKDYEKIKDKLSEKGSNLLKYSDAEYIYKWLSIFKNFKIYVDFLCFDDFVNKEDDEYYPKDIFTGKSITKDNISEYREKGKSKYKFIQNKATKEDLEKAFYNLIAWTIARSARMETIISYNDIINHNIWIINSAIIYNKQIKFTFNGYGKEGKLVPVREKKYVANPYYVVLYQQKYYMLCTHGKHEDVHIYRLDLMSDIELCEEDRESVRGVPELEHSNAKEYMDRHLNMFYDEPRTVTLKIKNTSSGYTSVHDQFGDKYTYKKKIDDEYDEIEVTVSGNAIIDYAIQYSDLVEIIRPKDLRNKLIDKINSIQKKYTDNK